MPVYKMVNTLIRETFPRTSSIQRKVGRRPAGHTFSPLLFDVVGLCSFLSTMTEEAAAESEET